MKAKSSKEIGEMRATDISSNRWMQEICIQLALLNESFALPAILEKPEISQPIAPIIVKRGPGRPKRVN